MNPRKMLSKNLNNHLVRVTVILPENDHIFFPSTYLLNSLVDDFEESEGTSERTFWILNIVGSSVTSGMLPGG